LSNGSVDFHLDEIDAWRSGQRASPGMPATGERYAGRMLDAIKRHEEALIALGHKPTIAYVSKHGFADGHRGRFSSLKPQHATMKPRLLKTKFYAVDLDRRLIRAVPYASEAASARDGNRLTLHGASLERSPLYSSFAIADEQTWTKKKSAAQLQREIDAAMNRRATEGVLESEAAARERLEDD
jgi:hypothetical protein